MSPNPIRTVLSSMRRHRVRCLLMGGQACVFYGAADKDWPMLRRLVEANYFWNRAAPIPDRVAFWLRELRTPVLLLEATRTHGDAARAMADRRPLLTAALREDIEAVAAGLDAEQRQEQQADRAYWAPLSAELETMRRARRAGPQGQA